MNLAFLMTKLSALLQEEPEYADYPVVIVSEHEIAEEAGRVRVGYSTAYESDFLLEFSDVEAFIEENEYEDEDAMVADSCYRKIIMID